MDKPSMFLFTILLINRGIYVSAGFWSPKGVCEMSRPIGINARTSLKYDYRKVCYFVVDGAHDRSNSWTSNLLWNQNKKFNISAAREICKQRGATLPILRTVVEQQHVVENYKSPTVENIALDLLLLTESRGYVWADGTPLDVKIPSKHVQSLSGKNHSFTVMRREGQEIVWYDYESDGTLWNGVAVVCRKEIEDKRRRVLELIVMNCFIVIVFVASAVVVVESFHRLA